MFTVEDLFKSANCLGGSHVLSCFAGKNFRNMERLAQETLNLPGTVDGQLVVGTSFIHTQNRNDILEILVALQDTLHSAGDIVVLLPHYFRRKRF